MDEQKISSSTKKLILIICIGLFAGFLIKLFAFDILFVSGKSMEPAIKDGSVLAVNKLAYGLAQPYREKLLVQWAAPKKGDVVIFLYNNKTVVKRCLATAGEKLKYTDINGYFLEIDNKKIPLSKKQYTNLSGTECVPQGFILAVGDNYDVSVDSREYGFVSEKNILGKVICIPRDF